MQIKQTANRAAALARQLLAFSRRQTLRPQTLQLNESCPSSRCCCADWSARRSARRRARPHLWPDQGRPQPVRAGDRQPRRQCPRRDAGWRQDHADAPAICPGRSAAELEEMATPADLRPDRSRGHRPWHSRRDVRPDLRALLHHQGGGQGNRPGPLDGLWHRQAVRRLCVLRKRARRGRDLPHPAPRA